ncbi:MULTISPECIES: MarR family winged helix-turn-helix transcriptional regulator [unclassified Cryobacterium]|uniref:MarR family winged helix-turn-helix transcriptional regulator n=1 Tax=unclassified Cryobacterium TaxID=2649013 RepID=UPI00106AFD11|nr:MULTISPECIES: MarR family transcriptional regulator [unclassified Cryobacterium]TFC53689.1 MarR family transcriptional regulator [Cryobacterium sp. TMB3-1-2]TFC75108.1 MarR family transcriptional regulator [Cryobacterium sp. TMB3-15]TFC75244.1 MarR family transcriptional regulator [Cryobacterium sp. TMB3-10]TFD41521.1 MarR family transcriptional regulator [Cryobacterium sp. TMB3-12]
MVYSRETAPTVGEALESALSTILRWSTRADNKRMLHDSSGAALSSTDSWLLERVVVAGPLRMSKLAGWMAVDKSTMTTEIRRLEKSGLVSRRSDPTDRRGVLITATEEGRTAIVRHRQLAQDVYGTLVGKWTEEDRTELARLLGRFVDELSWVTDAVARHNESI